MISCAAFLQPLLSAKLPSELFPAPGPPIGVSHVQLHCQDAHTSDPCTPAATTRQQRTARQFTLTSPAPVTLFPPCLELPTSSFVLANSGA